MKKVAVVDKNTCVACGACMKAFLETIRLIEEKILELKTKLR